jgi:hypothetical protein
MDEMRKRHFRFSEYADLETTIEVVEDVSN